MENSCLVTTLDRVVNNPNLMKINEVRFPFKVVSTSVKELVRINFTVSANSNVRILGGLNFSNSAGVDMGVASSVLTPGSNNLYVNANKDFTIVVDDKRVITGLGNSDGTSGYYFLSTTDPIKLYLTNVYGAIDFNVIKYLTNLTFIRTSQKVFIGSISDLSILTKLTDIIILEENSIVTQNDIVGSIESLSILTVLTRFKVGSPLLANTRFNITGDISKLPTSLTQCIVNYVPVSGTLSSYISTHPATTVFNVEGTNISGNTSVLAGKNLATFNPTSSPIEVNLADFASSTQQSADYKSTKIVGDLSRINNNLVFITNSTKAVVRPDLGADYSRQSNLTWSAVKTDRVYILALEAFKMNSLTDIKAFLRDMTGLILSPTSIANWQKTIAIQTTAALDSEVASLANTLATSKGVTVTITNI